MFGTQHALALAAVTAILTTAPGAHAGQPTTQRLVPTPPPWLTCKAVGDGTICDGTLAESYGPDDTGIACGSGPAAFEIFDSGSREQRKTRYYNEDGFLTRIVTHVRTASSQFSNPFSGAVVPYTQANTIVDTFAVPGDWGSVTETNVGENIYRDPASNKIVFRSVGRFVTAPDGDIESRSGKQNFLDVFVDGDQSVLEPLCAALSGP